MNFVKDKLHTNREHFLLSVDYIIDKLYTFSLREIVLKSFYISSSMTYYLNAYDYRENIDRDLEVHDVFKLINIYGYGVCKQFCLLFGFLTDIFNIPNKILYIGKKGEYSIDHFVIEVFYDSKWHFFDPMMKLFFKKGKDIVSLKEIEKGEYEAIVGDLVPEKWLLFNPEKSYFKNENSFKKAYLNMFENVEEFTLIDERYFYKKQLLKKKSIIKWYCYNEKKFLPKYSNIETIDKGFGIVLNKRIPSNENIQFKNYLISYNNPFKSKEIYINDFPLLILDIKICIEEVTNIQIVINDNYFDLSNSDGGQYLFNVVSDSYDINLFEHPIYSLYLKSEVNIIKYQILAQSTYLKDKIVKLLL